MYKNFCNKYIVNRVAIVLCMLAGFVNPTAANAKLEISQCSNLQKGLTAVCGKHKMCNLVLSQHKSCDKAQEFLSRLNKVLAGRYSLTSNDVFEAALPPVTGDPEFSKISNSLRAAYLKQKGNTINSGTTAKGAYWVYDGPMVNGKKHGIGIMANSGGLFFRGTFVNEAQTGQGEDRNVVTDERYAGQMLGGLANGSGIMRKQNGNRYVGSFEKDKRHGRGVYTWPSGDRYEGSFDKNNRTGQAVYSWADGTRFEGEYRDNKRYNGVERNVNGKVYVYANGSMSTGNANTPSPQQAALDRERAAKRKQDWQEALAIVAPTIEATGNQDSKDMLGLLQALSGGGSSNGGASGGNASSNSGSANTSGADAWAAGHTVSNCSFAGYDQAIAQFTRDKPQSNNWGARDTYQYAYYFGAEGLNILAKYKSCMSEAEYRDNYATLVGARDQGLKGCQQLSSDGGASCRPAYPG